MPYKSETIACAIGHMNQQYFLPAIQREFVWKPVQIIQLFDSIMRGYPISSFLFWALKAENRDKWQVYRFLERVKAGGTHNELANTDGITNLSLILDGQQRLTSLMIGLKGTYVTKKKHARLSNPDAWCPQGLHLDLLADPQLENDDAETGIYYKFDFMENPPTPNSEHHWFRIGRILDFDVRSKFEDFSDNAVGELPDTCTVKQTNVFRRNLDRLYKAIHEDEVIAYYTEADQDYDRVLDIFVRANEGGTKLSKSDLLLSMVISSWDGMNARDEIFNFVDYINRGLTRENDFDKDFIMKSCLVLTDLAVVYKVQNFDAKNLTKIRENWPDIRSAVQRGVDLANSFGIDKENLTSVNALIPIIYFLFKNPTVTLRGTTPFEVRNAELIRRWLIMALLKGAFGRASDGLLHNIRASIQDTACPGSDFPVRAINTIFAKTGLSTEFDDFALDEFLALSYGKCQTFLALSLLYDDAAWGTIQFHKDHLFAKSLFSETCLDEWRDKDRIGNLCLLLAQENIGKQDTLLEDWLPTRAPGFLKRHLIPEDRALWKRDRFPCFLKAREELIKQRLITLFDH